MIFLKGTVRSKEGEERRVEVSGHDDEAAFAALHEEVRGTEWVALSIEGRVGSLKSKTFSREKVTASR